MKSRMIMIGAALVISASALQAKPAYVATAKKAGIKNASCATCHVGAGPKLNAYGKKVKKNGKVTVASIKKSGKP